jgi:hypothetical protein
MQRAEIEAVVVVVLTEQRRVHALDIEGAVQKAVVGVLDSFGIDENDQKELRADFLHLRRWRMSVEQAQSYTFKAVITAIVGGFLGAIWLGVKAWLGK